MRIAFFVFVGCALACGRPQQASEPEPAVPPTEDGPPVVSSSMRWQGPLAAPFSLAPAQCVQEADPGCAGIPGLASTLVILEHPVPSASGGVPQYDSQGRLVEVDVDDGGGTAYAGRKYTYFASGALKSESSWGEDPLAHGTIREWDEVGHVLHAGGWYDDSSHDDYWAYVDALVGERWGSHSGSSYGGTTEFQYAYDVRGRLLLSREASVDQLPGGISRRTASTSRYVYLCGTDLAVVKEVDTNEDGKVDARQCP